MRKLFIQSTLLVALCAPLAWAEEAANTEPAEKPSKESAEKVAKADIAAPAKAKEGDTSKLEQFDPQSYTCSQFLTDLEKPGKGGGEAAGIALIWLHGFHSAVYGTDEVGALDEETIGEFAKNYGEYCKAHPKENFSRASKNNTKEEE